MLTRHDLAGLSRTHEDDLVLSVYIARDGSDPGNRAGWKLHLDSALGAIRAGLEKEAPGDLAAFDEASTHVVSGLEAFGRVLPYQGWSAFATAEGVFHAEGLPFAPPDLVRWRQGMYAAPYVRTLESVRPVTLVLLDRWHARVFTYEAGRLSEAVELQAERSVDEADVGMSKRASATSGRRGGTRADHTQFMLDEEAKRLGRLIVEEVFRRAGDAGGVILGGMPRAISALRTDLEEKLAGRIIEAPALSFHSTDADIATAAAAAASELTGARQARLLEACTEAPELGSTGWNRTYRALAAGAVDTLLVARGLIRSSPDDAERLVRLALAQGAEVEELGDELGARLMATAEGVAARLRFRLAA